MTTGHAATKGRHSAENDSWNTPEDIVARALYVLNERIDLDPASDENANEWIGARRILTREDDALTCNWFPGTTTSDNHVFLNPPGGTRRIEGRKRPASLPGLFWQRLWQYRESIRAAIWVAFSVEDLQRTQKWSDGVGQNMLGPCTAICVPRDRLRFTNAAGVPGKAPSHSNAIVLVTPEPLTEYARGYRNRFLEAFLEIGAVK